MQSNQNAIKAGSATREASSVDRIRELADSLGFVPDIDVLLLTGWSPVTLEQYRRGAMGRRMSGSASTTTYPTEQLAKYLGDRVNERRRVDAKGVL